MGGCDGRMGVKWLDVLLIQSSHEIKISVDVMEKTLGGRKSLFDSFLKGARVSVI